MKKILIILLLLTSISFADTYRIEPYMAQTKDRTIIDTPLEVKTPGVAFYASPNEMSNIEFKIAYEGNLDILNDYIPKDEKIDNTNVYIGVGYKF